MPYLQYFFKIYRFILYFFLYFCCAKPISINENKNIQVKEKVLEKLNKLFNSPFCKVKHEIQKLYLTLEGPVIFCYKWFENYFIF